MENTSLKKKVLKYILAVLILTAAFLRFYRITDYMEFLGDQGRDMVVVHRFLTKGDLMFIGPQTSIGNMYLGPWYYYLIAPALLFAFFNPVGPAVLVALLSVFAVWLIWYVAKKMFDRETAVLAAAIFALSPTIIGYSTFSWNPNIMPLFSLLSIWFTWKIWHENDFKKIPYLALSLVMVLNSHYLGLLLLPPVFLFWTLGLRGNWSKNTRRSYILYSVFSLLIFFLLMSPLLIFDFGHNFINLKAIYNFFAIRQETVNLKFYKGLLSLPKIIDQIFASLFLGEDSWKFSYWLAVPLLVGIGIRKNKNLFFILSFLIVGLFGLSNYKQHIYAHYFGFILPAVIITIAFVSRKLLPYSIPLVLFLTAVMVSNWHGWQRPHFLAARTKKITDSIIDRAGSQNFSLALIAEQNYDPPYRYFINLTKAPLVDLHQEIPETLFVVCEPGGKVECKPIGHPLWEIAAFGWAKIEEEWQIDGVTVFKLVHENN